MQRPGQREEVAPDVLFFASMQSPFKFRTTSDVVGLLCYSLFRFSVDKVFSSNSINLRSPAQPPKFAALRRSRPV